MEQIFPGIYRQNDQLYTENAVPGEQVYDEPLKTVDGTEYRRWSRDRSKAAAAITKGLRTFPVEQDDTVLYLGASTGTTVSHLSDILTDGFIHAVEYAPAVARSLLTLAETRDNIAPILGDARTPADYAPLITATDIIYQDVAQQDQVGILKRNAERFLRPGGHAVIAVKAQSIASSRAPEAVFDGVKDDLTDMFDIVDGKKLAPFHDDHLFLVLDYPA